MLFDPIGVFMSSRPTRRDLLNALKGQYNLAQGLAPVNIRYG